MSLAGHVSKKMLAHYGKARLTAKRNAVATLTPAKPTQPQPEPEANQANEERQHVN